MTVRERLSQAAAWELAARLTRGHTKGIPAVGETARQAPPPGPGEAELMGLAREVVDAILDLGEGGLDRGRIAKALTQAAQKSLKQTPELQKAYLARVMADLPRLLNLPRLLDLANQGLSPSPAHSQGLVSGSSAAFAKVMADLDMVAGTDLPVLLIGESGTGKELLAQRLHKTSGRKRGPLVTLNCAAIPSELVESELFGHVKGAFTGAKGDKPGYLRAASGGTLFLDEIGESGYDFQVRLLRALEDRVVVPVGSHQGMPVDFRLVAASHLDLNRRVDDGLFSRALLHRLMVVPVHLPPLRERTEDLPALARHFLEQAASQTGRMVGITPEALRALAGYDWPGNLRELKHLLTRLAALSRTQSIELDDLPPEILDPARKLAQQGWESHLVMAEGVPPARVLDLAAFLASRQGNEITNRDLREHLGCSDSTAKNLLRAVSEAGLITTSGERGGRRYLILELRED